MKIKDRAKPKTPPVAPGVYVAVCVGIIDLGEQYSETFKKYSNEVQIVWELVGETIEVDGEPAPRQLSKTFAVTTSKKGKLRAFLSDWNGRQYSDAEFAEFELFDQLGKACQVQVVQSEDVEYSNISTVMGLPKGMPAPETNTAMIRWDMEQWNDEAFAALPNWVQEKIKRSTQYQKLHTPQDKIDFAEQKQEPVHEPDEACPI